MKMSGTLKAVVGGNEIKTVSRMMHLLKTDDFKGLAQLSKVKVLEPLTKQMTQGMGASLSRHRTPK